VAALLVADFVLFGYMPSYKRLKELKSDRLKQKTIISRGSAQKAQLSVLQDRLSELQKKVSNYRANLPEDRQLGEFLHQVASLMNEQDLTEQRIEPGKETAAGKLNCIPMKMSCCGNLEQIFGFYKKLQGLDRFVRIQQVRLVNDSDFAGRLSMQTNAVVYYSRDGEG